MDIELFIEKNKNLINNQVITIKNGMAYINLTRYTVLNESLIKQIIGSINFFYKKFGKNKIHIVLNFGKLDILDKLSYILIECICYHIITVYHQAVSIIMVDNYGIWTEGILSSPLLLLKTGKKHHLEKFIQKFNNDIYHNHYRRIIHNNDDQYYLCNIMAEIDSFLKYFSVDENSRDNLAKVVVELVGNAKEHADGDSLIDIDIAPSYLKRDEEGEFYGVNFVVLNFSNKLMGHGIETKIHQCSTDRYQKVMDAYNNHKQHFSETYIEQDFFTIASFQDKISGTLEKSVTGGKGLTFLISSLENRSHTYCCYLLSGNRILLFKHDILEYNKDGWIGFNDVNDFINNIPKSTVIGEGQYYFPGTAYNLNFILRKEDSNE